ncbi:MAG TPA: DegT/DnrJ/EryC1/StrS family aminotransferase [Phycisphaerae bacterium]|nr:DegT/DnrJ/EryC1/StrS family aminotransferase [Phycisphaerae bacterium]
MKVPLLDLKAQYESIRPEVEQAIQRVIGSQAFTLGPEVEALEKALAAYCQCRYAIGVSSGTDALLCSLMALEIGPGDEVIVPTFTFFATAGVVARLGAKPVFVDIEADTYNIDPAGVESAVTERTKAIIPVHLFGQCADMDAVLAIAQSRSIHVIEDAAQAIGAEYKGRRAGGMGRLGCLSFYPTKNLGGFGDGGMIVTNDADLAARCRSLRMHGFRADEPYYHDWVGGCFRLDALQAAVLRVKFDHLEAWTQARQRNARRYDELLAPLPVAGPVVRPGNRMVYNLYVVRVPERDRVRAAVTAAGIGTNIYYPLSLHLQPCFAHLGHKPGEFPVAERATQEVLALPVYPELTAAQQQHVVKVLTEAVSE